MGSLAYRTSPNSGSVVSMIRSKIIIAQRPESEPRGFDDDAGRSGAVGDNEQDLFQQIVDGSKSVIRPLAVRIGPARIATFGGS
jgi:hypothetical protein